MPPPWLIVRTAGRLVALSAESVRRISEVAAIPLEDSVEIDTPCQATSSDGSPLRALSECLGLGPNVEGKAVIQVQDGTRTVLLVVEEVLDLAEEGVFLALPPLLRQCMAPDTLVMGALWWKGQLVLAVDPARIVGR